MNEPLKAGSGKKKKLLKPLRRIMADVDFDSDVSWGARYSRAGLIHPDWDTELHEKIKKGLKQTKQGFESQKCLDQDPFFQIVVDELLQIDQLVNDLFKGGSYICFNKDEFNTLHCIGHIPQFPEINYVVITTPNQEKFRGLTGGKKKKDLNSDLNLKNMADVLLHKPLDDYYSIEVNETSLTVDILLNPVNKYSDKYSILIPLNKRSEYLQATFAALFDKEFKTTLYQLPEKVYAHIYLTVNKYGKSVKSNTFHYHNGYFNNDSFKIGLVQAIREHGEVPKPPKVQKKKKETEKKKINWSIKGYGDTTSIHAHRGDRWP